MGTVAVKTNSRHHQAVKDVAPGFDVTARAPDGVIEGIEHQQSTFIVGVQWHPESLAVQDEQMLGLFKALVQASSR
jgi:putative glutamine amidotransferase